MRINVRHYRAGQRLDSTGRLLKQIRCSGRAFGLKAPILDSTNNDRAGEISVIGGSGPRRRCRTFGLECARKARVTRIGSGLLTLSSPCNTI